MQAQMLHKTLVWLVFLQYWEVYHLQIILEAYMLPVVDTSCTQMSCYQSVCCLIWYFLIRECTANCLANSSEWFKCIIRENIHFDHEHAMLTPSAQLVTASPATRVTLTWMSQRKLERSIGWGDFTPVLHHVTVTWFVLKMIYLVWMILKL